MAGAHLELPDQNETRVEVTTAGAERPAPSPEQQLLADDLFSHAQDSAGAMAPAGMPPAGGLAPAYGELAADR